MSTQPIISLFFYLGETKKTKDNISNISSILFFLLCFFNNSQTFLNTIKYNTSFTLWSKKEIMYYISIFPIWKSQFKAVWAPMLAGSEASFELLSYFWCLQGVVPADPFPGQQGLNSNSLVKPHSRRGVGTGLRAALAVWIFFPLLSEENKKEAKVWQKMTFIKHCLVSQCLFHEIMKNDETFSKMSHSSSEA